MDRKSLIEAVEKDTQDKVKDIILIHGIGGGDNVGDNEELYHYGVSLQLEFKSGKFISVTVGSFCKDPSRAIATAISHFKLKDIYSDFNDLSEELESILIDYITL